MMEVNITPLDVARWVVVAGPFIVAALAIVVVYYMQTILKRMFLTILYTVIVVCAAYMTWQAMLHYVPHATAKSLFSRIDAELSVNKVDQ